MIFLYQFSLIFSKCYWSNYLNDVKYNPLYYLSECGRGWYGGNCSRRCVGHCKDGATCNHVTGQCNGGCDAGWEGYLCEKGNLNNTKLNIVNKIQT